MFQANTSKTEKKTDKKEKEKEKESSSGRSSSASNKRRPTDDKSVSSGNSSKKKRGGSAADTDNDSVLDDSSRPTEVTGFDKGLEAEKILGASDSNGGLTFLIQFKGVDQAEMVPAPVANIKIPQMVIKFYEERLSWYSDTEE